jgi:hypothetical protein
VCSLDLFGSFFYQEKKNKEGKYILKYYCLELIFDKLFWTDVPLAHWKNFFSDITKQLYRKLKQKKYLRSYKLFAHNK